MELSLQNPIPWIQSAKHQGLFRYSSHGLRMMRERNISQNQVEIVLNANDVELLENYPKDPRGPSCLVLGWDESRTPIHVVVGLTTPDIVTAYEPEPPKWTDPRTRGGR